MHPAAVFFRVTGETNFLILNPFRSAETLSECATMESKTGQGQESGIGVPLGFGARVKRAFEVVHRRVQDTAMHHLHSLKESGILRGFAMPYLGQQDAALPWKPFSWKSWSCQSLMQPSYNKTCLFLRPKRRDDCRPS